MPLYEYECKKCHHRFERIVKYSDRPMKKCPDCGGPVEQTVTAPAVQFKGSGFYVTDYPKKSGDSTSSGESTAPKSDSAKSESSSKGESSKAESSKGESSKKESSPRTESSSKKDDKPRHE